MDARFYNIDMMSLLWVLPVLALLFYFSFVKRKGALVKYGCKDIIEKMATAPNAGRIFTKAFLTIIAIVFIVIALARPAWNPVPKTVRAKGRDVVFLIDVSNSMLATDLAPNRLERSKLAVKDCVEKLKGDRVGIVAFAGSSVVKCPLTLDYGFFRMALDELSSDSVSRGGTLIGDAIRRCLNDVFDEESAKFRDIILITDGEDHESFPVEAAAEAGKRGVRLIIIGIGDENSGRRIPLVDENGRRYFLKDKSGKEVCTKLNAKVLRDMARSSKQGVYFNVATGMIDLGSVYTDLIAKSEKNEYEQDSVRKYEEKFQIFLLGAFILLVLEMFVSEIKRK
jgi:Ca-activated chloride channel family protein